MPRPGTDFEIKANCIFAAVQISIKSSDLKMAQDHCAASQLPALSLSPMFEDGTLRGEALCSLLVVPSHVDVQGV